MITFPFMVRKPVNSQTVHLMGISTRRIYVDIVETMEVS